MRFLTAEDEKRKTRSSARLGGNAPLVRLLFGLGWWVVDTTIITKIMLSVAEDQQIEAIALAFGLADKHLL